MKKTCVICGLSSGISFIDNEMPIKKNHNKSRRIKRELFKSNNGKYINADVNAAYQIIKKVFANAFDECYAIEGSGYSPLRVDL